MLLQWGLPQERTSMHLVTSGAPEVEGKDLVSDMGFTLSICCSVLHKKRCQIIHD